MIELGFWIAVWLFVIPIALGVLWGLCCVMGIWFEPSYDFEEQQRKAYEQADLWLKERRQ